jgi:hypothetical protein
MKSLILLTCGIFLLSGCASISRGTTETFSIQTMPTGVAATLSNGLACTTPCTLTVKRRGTFTVTLEKKGYETIMTSVVSSRDGAGTAGMAGNLLVGGIVGIGVDAATGAMNSHVPNPLVVTMVKTTGEDASSE